MTAMFVLSACSCAILFRIFRIAVRIHQTYSKPTSSSSSSNNISSSFSTTSIN